MTGPNQPAPRPLPNPGPPSAPVVGMDPVTGVPLCEHGDDAVACQLRHSAPNQPGPGPKPHLPYMDPRTRIVRLPTLAQIVGDATNVLNAAIAMLGRQWDPATGPSVQDDPWGPEAVDIHLGNAVRDVRSALAELASVAAMCPARQSTRACLPGGPPNHLAAAPASGGLLPGLADAAVSEPGGVGGSVAPDAGASSDPGRRLSQRAPEGNGVTPGVGFNLPQAKRWSW